MSLRAVLPYVLVCGALLGYLFYRIQGPLMPSRRRPGSTRWHERGRARRMLRITRSWERLGHRDGDKRGR